MNSNQWQAFCAFKKDFKKKIKEWSCLVPELARLAAEEQGKEEKALLLPCIFFVSRMSKSGYLTEEEIP